MRLLIPYIEGLELRDTKHRRYVGVSWHKNMFKHPFRTYRRLKDSLDYITKRKFTRYYKLRGRNGS